MIYYLCSNEDQARFNRFVCRGERAMAIPEEK
jgi:hypothetical protein